MRALSLALSNARRRTRSMARAGCAALALAVAEVPAADLPAAAPAPAPAADAALQTARAALKARDWTAAEAQLRALLQRQPDHADAWNLLGFALRWQDRYEESLAAYQQAFRLQPDHLGAHEYIARTYLKMGRRADAERHLARLRELCPACQETRALAELLAAGR